jgi:hypothetical protein
LRTFAEQPTEAIADATEALRRCEAMHGAEHSTTAMMVLVLANARELTGDLKECDWLANRALRTLRQRFGESHFELSEVYELLGRLAVRKRDYPTAESHFHASLRMCDAVGREHPLRVYPLRGLAEVYRLTDRDGAAMECDELADTIVDRVRRGIKSPTTVNGIDP